MPAYSFLNTACALTGPGGSLNLGSGAAVAEEGIIITPTNPIDTMVIGADGTPMHSLHGDRSGKISIKLLKTSPLNQKLAQMYAMQTSSAANHGQNNITLVNSITQDTISCTLVAFEKAPDLTYAKEAGLNEWTFLAGTIDRTLGAVA